MKIYNEFICTVCKKEFDTIYQLSSFNPLKSKYPNSYCDVCFQTIEKPEQSKEKDNKQLDIENDLFQKCS